MEAFEHLKHVFVEEAGELLADLEAAAMEIETAPDDAGLIDRTFRILHTLKGAATMYGYTSVAALSHELESVLDLARTQGSRLPAGTADLTLRVKDCIGRSIARGPEDGADADLEAGLAAECRALGAGDALGAEGADVQYRIVLSPGSDSLRRGVNVMGLLEELSGLGRLDVEVEERVPRLEDLDVRELYASWRLTLWSPCGRDALDGVLMFLDPGEYRVELVGDGAGVPGGRRGSGETAVGGADHVRVASRKLDRLVDLVGELVTAHAALGGIAATSGDPLLAGISEEVGRLTTEMRESVLEIRMVPIGSVFGRLKRHVRDLARDLGKEIEVVAEGGDTELDKTVIDRIEKPLLHILRNSVDHGIESPTERELAGKARAGVIRVAASQSGGNVFVEISDDGCGLDLARIRAKAVAAGLVSTEEELSDEETCSLVFRAGFSTASEVTSLSGRGVGLDVVSRAVQELQGAVSIAPAHDGGARVVMRLPLTLAIVEALLVSVGPERFMIPLSLVEECVAVDQRAEWRAHGREILDVRGEIVPFMRIRDFFGIPGRTSGGELAVIVSIGEQRFGLVVESIEDQIQAVMKNLGRQFGRAEGLSGASVLGDGSIALVLDAGELLRMLGSASEGGAHLQLN